MKKLTLLLTAITLFSLLGWAFFQTPVWADWSSQVIFYSNKLVFGRLTPLTEAQLTLQTAINRFVAEELVRNGGFEDGVNDWSWSEGARRIVGSEKDVAPFGAAMVRLGSNSSEPELNSLLQESWLEQQILSHVDGQKVQALSFWYNLGSYEDGVGFDQPALMVYLDDKQVFQVTADEVLKDAESSTLDYSGWKQVIISLPETDQEQYRLRFWAGNTGDTTHNSFVYLDSVSTQALVAGPNHSFSLGFADTTDAREVAYSYIYQGREYSGRGAAPLSFAIEGQPDDRLVKYWIGESLSLPSPLPSGLSSSADPILSQVFLDAEQPSAVFDLAAVLESSSEVSLEWSAPEDISPFGQAKATTYEVRYSLTVLSLTEAETRWAELPQLQLIPLDGLPGAQLRVSNQSELDELHLFSLPEGSTDLQIFVRYQDAAGNWSSLAEGSSVLARRNQ